MDRVFWCSAFVISYTYLGYPLLLAAWARFGKRLVRKAEIQALNDWPTISIVVAARNEGARLPDRLDNLLQLNYPGDREIIVVSDGSTDQTADALRHYQGRVRTVEVEAGGKPLALNTGVAAAAGEILIFADARQYFCSDALIEIVANFADPAVGGVTGELVLDAESGNSESTIGDGVGLYWTYEKWLRRKESVVWSTIGATGAIYAIRRTLWQPLPPETLLDDVLVPMRVVLAGRRVVFEERAQAFDRASADAASEAKRKTRTLAGNYQILVLEPRLWIPVVNPVWLQYMSHKVGRLVVPWALIAALVSSAVLAPSHRFFMAVFAAQLAFYLLAAMGGVLDARDRASASGIGDRKGATSWSH